MGKGNISFAALEPAFEQLGKLTLLQKVLIVAGTFILLIGSVVYFLYLPALQSIETKEKKLSKLENDLKDAKRKANELAKYESLMKKAQADFQVALNALPEATEIPTLLTNISESGKDAGLDFLLFKPRGEVRKDFYAEIPISINVLGPYHNLGVFYSKIALLPRIVNVPNISMTPAGGGNLHISCTAVTYRFLEKTKQSLANPNNSKRRKK